jgi:hypothetical protein
MQYLITLILVIFSTSLYSQNAPEDFYLNYYGAKAETSLYNEIELIDARHDTSFLGIVQLGLLNRKAKLVAKNSLHFQLNETFKNLVPQNAGAGKLLLLLRQYTFAEVTGAFDEKGYIYLKANLYNEKEGNYYLLNQIDTVFFIQKFDVTKPMIEKGSHELVDFVKVKLDSTSNSLIGYSKNDLMLLDSFEKMELPLFKNSVLKDGAYYSYESLKNQTPDRIIKIERRKNGKIKSVKFMHEVGVEMDLDKSIVYAIVDSGKMKLITKYGDYDVTRNGMDFNFTGKANVGSNSGDVIVATVFFGVIGGLIASADNYEYYEMKINHSNGSFLKLRKANLKTVYDDY